MWLVIHFVDVFSDVLQDVTVKFLFLYYLGDGGER